MFLCESITPFDFPVVPDVKRSDAISSGLISASTKSLTPSLRSLFPSSIRCSSERTFSFSLSDIEMKYSISPGSSNSGFIVFSILFEKTIAFA